MERVNLTVPVDATRAQSVLFTVDEQQVVLYLEQGFSGGSLEITAMLDGVEYPSKVSFSLSNNGPCGPFLLDRNLTGFPPNLVARVVPGSAPTPPASVVAKGRAIGGRDK